MKTVSPETVQRGRSNLAPVIGITGAFAFIGLALAWAAYMRRYVLHDFPMTAALSGELHFFESTAGRLAYYAHGPTRRGSTPLSRPAPAMVFIHSVNPAASSHEVKPLYEHYAQEYRAYSLDLPGYGFSERRNQAYTPQLYVDAINDLVSREMRGAPVDAVAVSLSSEFLALAALARPELYRSLTFISPTGINRHRSRQTTNARLLGFLLNPKWSRLFFDTLTSRPAVRFMAGLVQRNDPGRAMAHYGYVASHQPNAQFAPFYHLAGSLFTADIGTAYRQLTQPVLAVYGRNQVAEFEMADDLHAKTNWRVALFAHCGEFVQLDDPDGVTALIDQLLSRA